MDSWLPNVAFLVNTATPVSGLPPNPAEEVLHHPRAAQGTIIQGGGAEVIELIH